MEIERKFLVDELPAQLERHLHEPIAQGYVAIDGDVEVRVRRRGQRPPVVTVKSGGGQARVEEEFEIADEQFASLWALTEGRRIEKVRYLIPGSADLTFELDVYGEPLAGLVTVEVEFSSERAGVAFQPPGWLGREVTEDGRYKNRALAQHGLPDAPA